MPETVIKEKIKTNGSLLSKVLLSYKTTFDALCELINNSIQANATEIKINIDLVGDSEPSPYPFKEFRIIDNGNGVSLSDFNDKILLIATDVKSKGKGIGRFAAFQIGKIVEIETIGYDSSLKKYTKTVLPLNFKDLTDKKFDDCEIDVTFVEMEEKKIQTFYKVSIRDFWNDEETLDHPQKKIINKLLPGYIEEALFVKYSSYIIISKVIFYVNGKKLEGNDFLLEKSKMKTFSHTFSNGRTADVSLEFIHYKGKNKNILLSYRVDNNGIKTSGYEDLIKMEFPEENSWLVKIDCDEFNTKTDVFRNISLEGLDDDLLCIKHNVRAEVNEFFKKKNKRFCKFRDSLINDSFYPYKEGTSSDSIKIVFNQIAYYIEKDYSILSKQDRLRKVIYPLLDKAISNGDIEEVLKSIITLDDENVKKFKELLNHVELADMIKFSNDVANKQQFLDFLSEITYNDSISKHLRERSQLQKIIERQLWIFGEEYANTLNVFSDKNLSNNLDSLRKKCLKYERSEEDANFFECSDEKILDITDLFFYNEKILSNDKREIMIVELKAPVVKISQKELSQVDRYMYDIETIDHFSKDLNYKIIIVSSGLTKFAESQIGKDPLRPTFYKESKSKNIEIHVMKWSDIISRNKRRLSYLGNCLQTKEVSIKNIIKNDYPELDISNLKI
jgi:hypothetical protein